MLRPLLLAALVAVAGSGAAAEKHFVYVSGDSPTVVCFVLNETTGALTPASVTEKVGKGPSWLAWSPDHHVMYAVIEGESKVAAFAIAKADGALTRINDVPAAGNGPCHVVVHPSGKWVFVANYGSGHVGVLPVRADGGLEVATQTLQPGVNAHQVVCDPAGAFVFVPLKGSDFVAQYRFDATTGTLTPNDPAVVKLPAGAGPRHMAFAPSMKYAYVINELGGTMTRFTYDSATGLLSAPATVSTLPAGFTGKNTTAEVWVSGNGAHVYGTNRGHDSVALFSAAAATGELTATGHETAAGEIKQPRGFCLDPSGRFAYVASQKADYVTSFSVDAKTGAFTKLATTKVPAGPAFVGVMPAP
ncbi:MAG: lactonase family protein [Planctomycetes bacterium]|nr:lactonase family protein [Planctomycetota bacterium]